MSDRILERVSPPHPQSEERSCAYAAREADNNYFRSPAILCTRCRNSEAPAWRQCPSLGEHTKSRLVQAASRNTATTPIAPKPRRAELAVADSEPKTPPNPSLRV